MFPVLFGAGPIAAQESALFIEASLLMLIVLVPVIGLLFFFAWKYRKGSGARYEPEWEHSKLDELIWWAIPLEIVLVLSALTWASTHDLDPHKKLPAAANGAALEVEVVALPWKWLFIYPSYGIATLNRLEIPAGVPVSFFITADAPMNSFWIPALGGQIYAMTGMSTPLSLLASAPGRYDGMSANYSGDGFADMRFSVDAVTPDEFAAWAAAAKSAGTLDTAGYAALAAPGTSTPKEFGPVAQGLYNSIVEKYMPPPGHHH